MKRIVVSLVCLLLGSCGFYGHKPAMSFNDVPYTSVDGKAWPERSVELPGVAERHQLPHSPQMHYVELNPMGEPTIVFLHGLGSSLKFWRYQLDAFAQKGYRVIAIDHLGFGKSDKPATFSYDMPAMAEALHEALGHLGVERPILVGHSMGAHIAMTLTIADPDFPAALVLVSPAGLEKFSGRDKLWFKKVFSSALVLGADEASLWDSIRYNNFNHWKSEYDWLVEERVRVGKSPQMNEYAYANVRAVQGLLDTELVRDNLSRIEVPTIILYGNMDRLIPNRFMHAGHTREVMKFGHEGIQGSELVELSGCGHTAQIDCHEDTNREILRFVSGLVGRPPDSTRPPDVAGTKTSTASM